MGENSRIEWCDHTFNPWVGCTRISPACDNCYAEGWARRAGSPQLWQGERRRTSEANWRQPIRWDQEAEKSGVRKRVFCASLADVFDNQVPDEWRADLWDLIEDTPHLDWLLLTKRPQNILKMLPRHINDEGYDWPLRNVWLGTTVENQLEASRRIPALLQAPALVHFLSCEPLLGPINLRAVDIDGHCEMDVLRPSSWREVWEADWSPEATGMPLEQCIRDYQAEGGVWPPTDDRPAGISWVIAGGESGPDARPSHHDWFRSLRDQCTSAGVPFFMKQMWGPVKARMPPIPADLMIREMPVTEAGE